jgi:hypothetical protein
LSTFRYRRRIDFNKTTNNKQQTTKAYKINYIASCGHQHIVFYNVFKSRGTGIICPNCKNKTIGNKNGTIHFRVNPEKLSDYTNWLEPYLFNYETINEETNVKRLLNICQINE